MIGSSVGPYQVLGLLGAGGMGEVFLGHDTRLHRKVALKCLSEADAGLSDLRGRILGEARAAARLNHPCIAGVYDVVEHEGRAFIVMEYVAGESLATRLARTRIPMEQIVTIGRQLAAALASAHASGVIHRDLKPANIQLTPDGSIKVLDFGIARLIAPIATSSDTTVTATARGIEGNPGTTTYMSLEQLLGRPADARSDLYSLGVVLFEMAAGRRPYLETNAVELAVAMSERPAVAAHELNPQVPLGLSTVVARALEREPADRYQSARELELALAVVDVGEGPKTAATTASVVGVQVPGDRRGRVRAALAAVVILLGIGFVAREPLLNRMGLVRSASVTTPPIVLAILPVDNPGGDARAEYLGAGIAAVVVENFGSIRGLTVRRAARSGFDKQRDDRASLQKELNASHVLDLTLRRVTPSVQLVARLERLGAQSANWEETLEGDALAVESRLLDRLLTAFVPLVGRRLTPTELARIRKLPTASSAALLAYSEARGLLDRSDTPGNTDRAVALFQQAIATDGNFALAHAALGDAYWKQFGVDRDPSRAAKATEAVRRAIALDPDQASVHYSLAVMQEQTGHPDEAIASLRRAIELQPGYDDSHRLLGLILAEKGQIDAGVAELNEAIRIRAFWNNYYSLGFVLYNAGRYEEALAAYRRTTELQPTHAGGFQMLGVVQYVLGNMDQAVGNYEHAARLGPDAQAFANLAFAYFTAKRYDEAVAAYQRSLELEPKSVLNHRNIADVYQRLGRKVEAKRHYEAAVTLGEAQLTINPRDAQIISEIAISEARLGRFVAAERHAAEAVALAPSNQNVWLRSAKVHVVLGQTSSALKDLASAIERGYDPRMARRDLELESLRSNPRFQEITKAAGPDAARR